MSALSLFQLHGVRISPSSYKYYYLCIGKRIGTVPKTNKIKKNTIFSMKSLLPEYVFEIFVSSTESTRCSTLGWKRGTLLIYI